MYNPAQPDGPADTVRERRVAVSAQSLPASLLILLLLAPSALPADENEPPDIGPLLEAARAAQRLDLGIWGRSGFSSSVRHVSPLPHFTRDILFSVQARVQAPSVPEGGRNR